MGRVEERPGLTVDGLIQAARTGGHGRTRRGEQLAIGEARVQSNGSVRFGSAERGEGRGVRPVASGERDVRTKYCDRGIMRVG